MADFHEICERDDAVMRIISDAAKEVKKLRPFDQSETDRVFVVTLAQLDMALIYFGLYGVKTAMYIPRQE